MPGCVLHDGDSDMNEIKEPLAERGREKYTEKWHLSNIMLKVVHNPFKCQILEWKQVVGGGIPGTGKA